MHSDNRLAFTMIELVFVIVVLGILAAFAIPRLENDRRQEAADNILSAIRYTQHLALMDDKTDPTSAVWQRRLWQIRFSNPSNEWVYSIGSNMDDGNNLDQNESARDPLSGKYMHTADASPADSDESPDIFLTKKYGINNITLNGCRGSFVTNANHIAFDQFGRPHRGVTQGGANDYRTLVTRMDCVLTFTFVDGLPPVLITIERQTGHAFIQGQPDS